MRDRKVYVDLKVRLILRLDEGIEVGDVINDLNYDFAADDEGATIEDMSIEGYEVVDSK